jgi:hypothetical protein
MDAMEMQAMLMIGRVDEVDAHAISLAHTEGGAGDAPIVGPGRIENAGSDLNQFSGGDEPVGMESLAVGQRLDLSSVVVGQDLRRIEAVLGVIHLADDVSHGHEHRHGHGHGIAVWLC